MAKKEISRIAKLQFNAGQAKPGPELAGLGISMPDFTRQFNDQTKDRNGEPVPVQITIYKDKSFDFKTFTSPASFKLLQAIGVKNGSSNSKTTKVGTISREKLEEIAKYKMVDLNTNKLESAIKIIAGTARNMGILVEGLDDIQKELEEAKKAAMLEEEGLKRETQLKADAQKAAENKDAAIEVNTIKQQDKEEGEE